MSSEAEQNKALVRRLFEARVKTDLDALDKMLRNPRSRGAHGLCTHRQGADQQGHRHLSPFGDTPSEATVESSSGQPLAKPW